MSARILVADDDLWILRMIASILERRGHNVTLASDGEEALAHVLESSFDLLITDINMPRMDGWDLISALRSKDDLAGLPVIILTSVHDDDSRVRGYRLGVEDYVSKPFRFEELDLRVAKILARTEPDRARARPPRVETEPGSSIGLVGTLDQVALSSLLTLLELDRKTGILTVTRDVVGGVEQGSITIVGGRCHAAQLIDDDDAPTRPASAEALADDACVYQLLAWTDGRFEFDQREVTSEDRIGRSTTGLLMEAARLADEANR